jgi:hypothetical protein
LRVLKGNHELQALNLVPIRPTGDNTLLGLGLIGSAFVHHRPNEAAGRVGDEQESAEREELQPK